MADLLATKEFWAGLTALGGGLMAFWKVVRVVRIWWAKVALKITRIMASTDLVHHHLTRNGGSSLLDKVYVLEQVQRARAERELLFHEDADFGYFLCDPEGGCIRASRTFYRITGRTPGDITGYGWINALAPENRDDVVRRWTEAIDQRREFAEPIIYRRPDGDRVTCHVRAQPVLVDGKITEWIAVVREEILGECPLVAGKAAC